MCLRCRLGGPRSGGITLLVGVWVQWHYGRKATLSGDLLSTVLSISLLIFISELLLEFGNFGKRILIGLLHAHGRALGLVVVAKVLLAIQADGGDAFERLLLPWKRHRSAPFLFASCFLPGCKP